MTPKIFFDIRGPSRENDVFFYINYKKSQKVRNALRERRGSCYERSIERDRERQREMSSWAGGWGQQPPRSQYFSGILQDGCDFHPPR